MIVITRKCIWSVYGRNKMKILIIGYFYPHFFQLLLRFQLYHNLSTSNAMNPLKTLFLSLLIGLISYSHAQEFQMDVLPAPTDVGKLRQQPTMTGGDYDLNIAKINLLALPLRNFSLQYERMIARKISVGVGLGTVPRGSFPLLSSFESLIDDEETFNKLENIRVGSTAITVEPRFYFGKHDGPRGFYIAPYLRYSTYYLGFDEFEYTVELESGSGSQYEETRSLALSGRVNGFTGGVLFGAQWRIARRFYLDWWILGATYGTANGKLIGASPLNADEQRGLRESLEDLEIPMLETTTTVDANGGRLDIKGPWAGIRSGLAVGIKF